MTTEATEPSLARALMLAYFTSSSWTHRRVEALRLGSDGSTRHHVSHDFTLGLLMPGSKDRTYLPLGLVRKGALRGVDTEGPDGRPVPILSTHQNGQLAADLLVEFAQVVLPPSMASSPWLAKFAHGITSSEPDSARHWYRRYAAWTETQPTHDGPAFVLFEDVLTSFIDNFLLVVEIDDGAIGRRCVVKYSYEYDLPMLNASLPVALGYQTIQFGIAESWHFEVEAPPELSVVAVDVVERESSSGKATGRDWHDDSQSGQVQLGHVAARPSGRFETADVSFTLSPRPSGLVSVMWIGALVTLAVVAAGAVEAWGVVDLVAASPAGSPAVSLLLVGPALLLSWLSRTPEHEVTARVLRPMRRVLVGTAFSLMASAALAALPVNASLERLGWFLVLSGQVLVVGRALMLRRIVRSAS